DRAIDNVRRFVAAGGRVQYGTDLGNGERMPGLQGEELRRMDAAGIRGTELVAALTDPWPLAALSSGVATFRRGAAPEGLDAIPDRRAAGVVGPGGELIRSGR